MSIRINLKGQTITEYLDNIRNRLPDTANAILENTGDFMIADIRTSWHARPSRRGTRPAIKTGALDRSLFNRARNLDGYKKGNYSRYVYTNTYPINQKQYGLPLESEAYDRYFMRPSFEVTHKVLQEQVRKYVENLGRKRVKANV